MWKINNKIFKKIWSPVSGSGLVKQIIFRPELVILFDQQNLQTICNGNWFNLNFEIAVDDILIKG